MTDPVEDDLPDITIGRHAVRTFTVDYKHRKLLSLTTPGNHWEGGKCIATCAIGSDHTPPVRGCSCGIYGKLSLDGLWEYGRAAQELVVVFEAEGETLVGPTGLRVEAARVVAYWSPVRGVRRICQEQLGGARNFGDLDEMLSAYDIPRGNATPPPPRMNPTISALLWMLVCCVVVVLDTNIAYIDFILHRWAWGWALVVNLFMMLYLLRHYARRLRNRL
jgi:hypothetical protein